MALNERNAATTAALHDRVSELERRSASILCGRCRCMAAQQACSNYVLSRKRYSMDGGNTRTLQTEPTGHVNE